MALHIQSRLDITTGSWQHISSVCTVLLNSTRHFKEVGLSLLDTKLLTQSPLVKAAYKSSFQQISLVLAVSNLWVHSWLNRSINFNRPTTHCRLQSHFSLQVTATLKQTSLYAYRPSDVNRHWWGSGSLFFLLSMFVIAH